MRTAAKAMAPTNLSQHSACHRSAARAPQGAGMQREISGRARHPMAQGQCSSIGASCWKGWYRCCSSLLGRASTVLLLFLWWSWAKGMTHAPQPSARTTEVWNGATDVGWKSKGTSYTDSRLCFEQNSFTTCMSIPRASSSLPVVSGQLEHSWGPSCPLLAQAVATRHVLWCGHSSALSKLHK